jgi:hypothetical protein
MVVAAAWSWLPVDLTRRLKLLSFWLRDLRRVILVRENGTVGEWPRRR